MNNENARNGQRQFDLRLIVLLIVGLLILTAWGNAIAMLVFATMILAWLGLSRQDNVRPWPLVIGFVVAVIAVFAISLF